MPAIQNMKKYACDHTHPPQQQQVLVSIGRSELKIEYQIWYYSISLEIESEL